MSGLLSHCHEIVLFQEGNFEDQEYLHRSRAQNFSKGARKKDPSGLINYQNHSLDQARSIFNSIDLSAERSYKRREATRNSRAGERNGERVQKISVRHIMKTP